jgi:K+/H+ antiporter YhaU regulatory subunit KhtT
LLISSDSLISSLRKINNKKSTTLCDETKLLVCIERDNKEDVYINEKNSEDEFMEYE